MAKKPARKKSAAKAKVGKKVAKVGNKPARKAARKVARKPAKVAAKRAAAPGPSRIVEREAAELVQPSMRPIRLPSGSRNCAMTTIPMSVRGMTICAPISAALSSVSTMLGTCT